jgi:hypothetical protein
MEELTDKLNKLKEEAIANPGKKKKGCTSCKKKKPITEPLPLPDPIDIFDDVPTQDEIKLAYANLSRMGGPLDEHKELIDKVFIFLFGSAFDYNCKSCGNRQYSLITNYIKSMK